jgi:hypothetical protein
MVLEDADMAQSVTRKPYRKLPARVIKNGIEVVTVGYAIIENAEGNFYNVTIYSGNTDFFDLIEGKLLSDLDLSAYNHTWNAANIIASRTNVSGYKYPVINWGDLVNTNRDVYAINQRPAMFVHTLMDRIFSEAGYNKSGAVLDDSNYKKILYVNGDLKHSDKFMAERSFRAHIEPASFTSVGIGLVGQWAGLDNHLTNDFFDPSNKVVLATWNVTQALAGKILLKERDMWHVKLKFEISGWVNGTSIFKIINGIEGVDIYTHPNSGAGGGNGTFTHTFDEITDFQFDIDYTLTSIYRQPVKIIFQNLTVNIIDGEVSGEPLNGNAGSSTTDTIDEGYVWNRAIIEMAGALGNDISQKQLIQTVAQIEGLIFASDPLTKTIIFKKFDEIVAAIPIAKDWTDKLHMEDKQWKLEFRTKYAQKNWLKYQEDSNDKDIIKGTGNGYFTVDDETLPIKKDLFTVPVSASKMEKQLVELDVPIIRKIESTVVDFAGVPVGDFKTDAAPRILVDDTQDIIGGDVNYIYSNTSFPLLGTTSFSTNVPLCYFRLPGKAFNLDFFSQLLYNYQGLIACLDKSKKATLPFKITTTDIEELDHFIPVYLAQCGLYFYINKIINWIKGTSITKVELVLLQRDYEDAIQFAGFLRNYELEEDGSDSLEESGEVSAREDN